MQEENKKWDKGRKKEGERRRDVMECGFSSVRPSVVSRRVRWPVGRPRRDETGPEAVCVP